MRKIISDLFIQAFGRNWFFRILVALPIFIMLLFMIFDIVFILLSIE